MSKNSFLQYKTGNWRTILIWAFIFAMILVGCGEKKPKVYRVGILVGIAPFKIIADSFMDKMTDLGYRKGENIVYDLHVANVDMAGQRQILNKFVADGVDLIFALPTGQALAAKEATQGKNIPVLFAMAGLEGNDLVENIRKPGGNVTGIRFPGPDLTIKRFEILKEMAPNIKRLYIIYNKNYPANKVAIEALRPVALSNGVTLMEIPITSVDEIKADLEKRAESDDIGMDAIQILPDNLSQSPAGWTMISKFAAEYKVPIAGAASFTATKGAVFSYTPDNNEVGRLAAPIADKIFKGTPAGTIPVITPESYLRLNYKLAKELGMTVPEGLIRLASEVIR